MIGDLQCHPSCSTEPTAKFCAAVVPAMNGIRYVHHVCCPNDAYMSIANHIVTLGNVEHKHAVASLC